VARLGAEGAQTLADVFDLHGKANVSRLLKNALVLRYGGKAAYSARTESVRYRSP